MESGRRSISDLFASREAAARQRDEADAEVKRLDRLIEAVEFLKANGIEMPSFHVAPAPIVPRALSDSEAKRVSQRDREVLEAVRDNFPDTTFTVPELKPLLRITKRSIKRALDDMISRSEIILVEQGFKRKPTKYRLATTQDKEHVEAQDSPAA